MVRKQFCLGHIHTHTHKHSMMIQCIVLCPANNARQSIISFAWMQEKNLSKRRRLKLNLEVLKMLQQQHKKTSFKFFCPKVVCKVFTIFCLIFFSSLIFFTCLHFLILMTFYLFYDMLLSKLKMLMLPLRSDAALYWLSSGVRLG